MLKKIMWSLVAPLTLAVLCSIYAAAAYDPNTVMEMGQHILATSGGVANIEAVGFAAIFGVALGFGASVATVILVNAVVGVTRMILHRRAAKRAA